MPAVHLNNFSIVVAALINLAIGAMWFSPLLFASAWASAAGKKAGDIGKPSPIYLFIMLGALLEAYVLAHFASYALAMTAMDGARVGLWLTVGLVAPILGAVSLLERKGLKWFLILLGYNGLALMAMGAVLIAWS